MKEDLHGLKGLSERFAPRTTGSGTDTWTLLRSGDYDSRAAHHHVCGAYCHGNRARDLRPSNARWLDRIRVIGGLVADESKIDDREATLEAHPQDRIVERAQRGGCDSLKIGVREVAVVDG